MNSFRAATRRGPGNPNRHPLRSGFFPSYNEVREDSASLKIGILYPVAAKKIVHAHLQRFGYSAKRRIVRLAPVIDIVAEPGAGYTQTQSEIHLRLTLFCQKRFKPLSKRHSSLFVLSVWKMVPFLST